MNREEILDLALDQEGVEEMIIDRIQFVKDDENYVPSEEEISLEFDEYIFEMLNARSEDLKDRYNLLNKNYIHEILTEANLFQPNDALLLKEILTDDNEAKLILLETAASNLENIFALRLCFENRRQAYPSIEDLTVAKWENDQAKIDELEAKRQQVKVEFPKPV